MAESFEAAARKRDFYLQMMQTARRMNDRALIRLILKKMTRLGLTNAVSTASGCTIVPFPAVHYTPEARECEPISWWVLVKLTLAIPGSLAALLWMCYYRF